MKNNLKPNYLTIVLFIIYLMVLFWILLYKFGVRFSYMTHRNVNLIPFYHPLDYTEIILNILIFVPFGLYTGILLKNWTILSKLLCFFLLSLMFESLQYLLRIGAFDVTDIIANTTGGTIGLILFYIIGKLFNNNKRAQKFINIIALIGTLFLIILLVLLKLNKLPIQYQ